MARLIRYDPVYDVLRPAETLLDDWFAPERALSLAATPTLLGPAVESLGNLPLDIYETDKELVVEASLPGVREEDIKIEEHQGILTIRAEHEEETREEGETWFVHERVAQVFERSIPLPVEVNADKAQATLKDGVLRIVFPKVEQGKGITNRIKISVPKLKLPKLGKKEGKVKVKKA